MNVGNKATEERLPHPSDHVTGGRAYTTFKEPDGTTGFQPDYGITKQSFTYLSSALHRRAVRKPRRGRAAPERIPRITVQVVCVMK